jgi:conjugative relaxase-like TrwC/TraI family protein
MLSVYKMGMSKINYYLKQLVEYYAGRGEDPHARWLGTGAERAGLTGQKVEAEVFRNLLAGFDPTGEKKWVQNAGKFIGSERDRMPGYDLTFSVPKSLSYVWSICSPELRAEIEATVMEAVTRTIDQVEKLAHIRTGKGGKDHVSAGVMVMATMHHTARPRDAQTRPDPALHVHAIMPNTGIALDGRTGALNGLRFLNKKTGRTDKQFAKEIGEQFRQNLAELVPDRLGFGIRITDQGQFFWEVAGVSTPEIQRNSKRAKQIQEAARARGTTARKQVIKTRQSKREYEPSELFKVWREEAQSRGIDQKVIEDLRRTPEKDQERTLRQEMMRGQRGRGGIER